MLWITHIGAYLTFKQQDEKQDDIFKKESRKRHNPQGTNQKVIPAREGLYLYIKQKSCITHRNKSTETIVTTKGYSKAASSVAEASLYNCYASVNKANRHSSLRRDQ